MRQGDAWCAPNIATNEDVFWRQPDWTKSATRLTRGFITDGLIARVGFLKLLVRLRRVILQDAVLFLWPNDDGLSLSSPLLESLPGIFKCRLFVDFQRDSLSSMNAHRKQVPVIRTDIPVNTQAVVTAINNLVQHSNAMTQKMNEFAQEMNRKVDRLTEIMMELRQGVTQRTQSSQEQLNVAARQPHEVQAYPWLSSRPVVQRHRNYPSGSSTSGGLSLNLAPASLQNNPNPNLRLSQVVPIQQQRQSQRQQQQHHHHQQQQEQGQQQEQEQAGVIDPKIRGYIMHADSKYFTIRHMWDEFYGPVSVAKRQDPAWPYTSARAKLFGRRRQLVELLKQMAVDNDQSIEQVIADTSERYEGLDNQRHSTVAPS